VRLVAIIVLAANQKYRAKELAHMDLHTRLRWFAILTMVVMCALLVAPVYADNPVPPATDEPTVVNVQSAQVRPLGDLPLGVVAALLAVTAGLTVALVVRGNRATQHSVARVADRPARLSTRRQAAAVRSGARRPYIAPALVQRARLETHAGSPILDDPVLAPDFGDPGLPGSDNGDDR
jgi:hypothetical protein